MLCEAGLLEDRTQLSSLREALALLPAPQLKLLAKEFNVGVGGKEEVVGELLKLGKRKSSMAGFLTQVTRIQMVEYKQEPDNCQAGNSVR